MKTKFLALLAIFAILFGCAFCDDASPVDVSDDITSIKLHVFESSSRWWIAVDPLDDDDSTVNVEMKDAASSTWTEMMPNVGWGYFQQPSTSGVGFELPISFRLTDEDGNQVVLEDFMTEIAADELVDTEAQYNGRGRPSQRPPSGGNNNDDDGRGNNNNRPTKRPTKAPTRKPTQAPTRRPTQAPTRRPTQRPTQEPTRRPTSPPAVTQRPTQTPTQQATQRPTQQATQRPTSAPTQRPSTNGGSSSGSSGNLCGVTSTSSEPLKILVPLYVYPGAAWTQVANAASSGVGIIAIINPNSGPSSSGPDSSYTSYMRTLTNAGVEMVGYVHTSYGARSLTDVNNDINTYASKYPGLKGIFLDEVSNSASQISYYRSIYNTIMSKSGYVHDILNPGVQPDQGYLDISTNIVIFEDYGSNLNSKSFSSWVTCAPNSAEKAGYKYRFSGIAHTTSQSSMSSIISSMANKGMGLVYVTDGAGGCCTYNTLASYFPSEASSVKALN